jgi:hypothetical protein
MDDPNRMSRHQRLTLGVAALAFLVSVASAAFTGLSLWRKMEDIDPVYMYRGRCELGYDKTNLAAFLTLCWVVQLRNNSEDPASVTHSKVYQQGGVHSQENDTFEVVATSIDDMVPRQTPEQTPLNLPAGQATNIVVRLRIEVSNELQQKLDEPPLQKAMSAHALDMGTLFLYAPKDLCAMLGANPRDVAVSNESEAEQQIYSCNSPYRLTIDTARRSSFDVALPIGRAYAD